MVISNGGDSYIRRSGLPPTSLPTTRKGPSADPLLQDLKSRQQKPAGIQPQGDRLSLGHAPAPSAPGNPWETLIGQLGKLDK